MMMDTAVVTTDLDRLAERVEKAAALILELRTKQAQMEAKQAQLETEKAELVRRLEETTGKLQGNDPTALVTEVAALKKEQREWVAERKDVATRIESLLRKLDRIEG
jgi:chromosome segregation ATPase